MSVPPVFIMSVPPVFIMSVPPVMHNNINAMFNQGQISENFLLLEWCKKEKNEFIVS